MQCPKSAYKNVKDMAIAEAYLEPYQNSLAESLIKPLSANHTNLSVFDHFVELALKELKKFDRILNMFLQWYATNSITNPSTN